MEIFTTTETMVVYFITFIMFFSYWDLTVNPAPLGYRRFQIGCVFAEYLFKGPTYSPIALSLLQTKLADKTAD